MLFGVCVINDQQFFFMDVIFDIWRNYLDGTHERLWSIFGVYDISIKQARDIIEESSGRHNWEREIMDISECVGVFWEYEKAGEFKEWSERD